jgi:DNA-binding IclR family transcriptional regulator
LKSHSKPEVHVAKHDAKQRPYASAVAVERAVDALFIIAERGEVTLTELARTLGSSGSAVHRILTALKKKGLIEQSSDNGRYLLSWSILALTQRLTAEADLRSLSLPFMIKLRDLANETVTINVRSGFSRVCIDQVEALHEVRWRQEIGRISPLYAGATGKAILAYLRPDELKEFFQTVTLEKLTPYTSVGRREVMQKLERIRGQGYALGSQDRILGVAGISAPIFNRLGHVVGALTIAGPAERCTQERLRSWVDALTDATRQISRPLSLQPVAEDLGQPSVAQSTAVEAPSVVTPK